MTGSARADHVSGRPPTSSERFRVFRDFRVGAPFARRVAAGSLLPSFCTSCALLEPSPVRCLSSPTVTGCSRRVGFSTLGAPLAHPHFPFPSPFSLPTHRAQPFSLQDPPATMPNRSNTPERHGEEASDPYVALPHCSSRPHMPASPDPTPLVCAHRANAVGSAVLPGPAAAS